MSTLEGTDPRDSSKCLGHFARSTSHSLCHPELQNCSFPAGSPPCYQTQTLPGSRTSTMATTLSPLLSLQTAPAHLLKASTTHQLVLLSLIEQGLMIILALRHLEQRVWPRSDYCVGDCGSHLRRCDSGSACHRCSQVLTKPPGTLPLRATKEKGLTV